MNSRSPTLLTRRIMPYRSRISASAGITTLAPELTAGEVFRRATLSLTAARGVGAGTVLQYREPA